MSTPTEGGRPTEGTGLRVMVLSCGDLGIEVANALSGCSAISGVTLVSAPYTRKTLTLTQKLRRVYRMEGPWALISASVARMVRPIIPRRGGSRSPRGAEAPDLKPGIERLCFPEFHDPNCIAAMRALAPDLGVVAGTYILNATVFEIPRMGSINLHSGKAPEYRGAAPVFWELYNGEDHVGITIHRVASDLDAGHVLRQEIFPLDPVPNTDPIEYIERYRRDVLRPHGIRLVVETVLAIADGSAQEEEQEHGRARNYKSPDYGAIRELRRRVRARRRLAETSQGVSGMGSVPDGAVSPLVPAQGTDRTISQGR